MALQSSGAITLAQIAAEFGGSTPHSLSEYYGAASGVPSSGTISFDDFYGTSSNVTVTRTSNGNDISLSNEFGSNWAANIPKIYNINSGVTIHASAGVGNAALAVNAGMGGTLVINNAGSIEGNSGAGGAGGAGGANGSNGSNGNPGGTAIKVQSGSPTINNTGAIRGGGGGGGGGGGSTSGRFIYYSIPGQNGGAGGTGQGYNQSNTGGGNGVNSTFNICIGGDGGNGGTWGTAGSNGGSGTCSSGADGSNGSGGTGGAAGKAIENAGSSWTNGTTSGTYNGSYT